LTLQELRDAQHIPVSTNKAKFNAFFARLATAEEKRRVRITTQRVETLEEEKVVLSSVHHRLRLPEPSVSVSNPTPLKDRTEQVLADKAERMRIVEEEMYPELVSVSMEPERQEEFLSRQFDHWDKICETRGMGHKWVEPWDPHEEECPHTERWTGADTGVRDFRTPPPQKDGFSRGWLDGNGIISPERYPSPAKALGAKGDGMPKRYPTPPKHRVKEALWVDAQSDAARSISTGRFQAQPDPRDVAGEWSNASLLSHKIDPREKGKRLATQVLDDPRYKKWEPKPKSPTKRNLDAIEHGARLHSQTTASGEQRRKALEQDVETPTKYLCSNAHSRRGVRDVAGVAGGRGPESPIRMALTYRTNGYEEQHRRIDFAAEAEAGSLSPLQAAVLKALKGPESVHVGSPKKEKKPPLSQTQPGQRRGGARRGGK